MAKHDDEQRQREADARLSSKERQERALQREEAAKQPINDPPPGAIGHSITDTMKHDQEAGLIGEAVDVHGQPLHPDAMARKTTGVTDTRPGGVQSDNPDRFDGRLYCVVEAGNGFRSEFEFGLPNVVGAIGLTRMNEDTFVAIIQEALVDKIGLVNVVRRGSVAGASTGPKVPRDQQPPPQAAASGAPTTSTASMGENPSVPNPNPSTKSTVQPSGPAAGLGPQITSTKNLGS